MKSVLRGSKLLLVPQTPAERDALRGLHTKGLPNGKGKTASIQVSIHRSGAQLNVKAIVTAPKAEAKRAKRGEAKAKVAAAPRRRRARPSVPEQAIPATQPVTAAPVKAVAQPQAPKVEAPNPAPAVTPAPVQKI